MSDFSLSDAIKRKSVELGFFGCGILPAGFLSEEEDHLHAWLSAEMYGEMNYMARYSRERLDPARLIENARTVIVVLQNYFTRAKQSDPLAPILSKYAYGKDYHLIMRAKLNRLLEFIRQELKSCNGRVFVDSAPVLERAWAKRAGLGWVGKNSQLISDTYGSFFFIGELIIDCEIPCETVKEVNCRCGNCTRCMDACPAKAIVAPMLLDARRCISYLTIEHKGETAPALREKLSNRVFGCDICQDVCPWNRNAVEHNEPGFLPHPSLLKLSAEEWYRMDESLFRELFDGSAVMRAGYEKMKRSMTNNLSLSL